MKLLVLSQPWDYISHTCNVDSYNVFYGIEYLHSLHGWDIVNKIVVAMTNSVKLVTIPCIYLLSFHLDIVASFHQQISALRHRHCWNQYQNDDKTHCRRLVMRTQIWSLDPVVSFYLSHLFVSRETLEEFRLVVMAAATSLWSQMYHVLLGLDHDE